MSLLLAPRDKPRIPSSALQQTMGRKNKLKTEKVKGPSDGLNGLALLEKAQRESIIEPSALSSGPVFVTIPNMAIDHQAVQKKLLSCFLIYY